MLLFTKKMSSCIYLVNASKTIVMKCLIYNQLIATIVLSNLNGVKVTSLRTAQNNV